MSNSEPHTIKYKTVLHSDKNKQTVVYYETPIVEFDEKEIILNTGGYRTRSTQSRMNWVSREFDLDYRIGKKRGVFGIFFQGELHPFEDDIIHLNRKTGKVTAVKAAE